MSKIQLGKRALAMRRDLDGVVGHDCVRAILEWGTKQSSNAEMLNWSAKIYPHLTLVAHSPAQPPHNRLTFGFDVRADHSNSTGMLHGGCTATLFDICTTLLLHDGSRPAEWEYIGVTRSLNMNLLRPAPVGSHVVVECETVQIGKQVCLLRGTIRNAAGQTISTCEHTRINVAPVKPKL